MQLNKVRSILVWVFLSAGPMALFFSCAHFLPGDAPEESTATGVSRLTFDPAQSQRGLIDLLENARESIYVSLYGFDNEEIDRVLIKIWQEKGTSRSLAYAKANRKVKMDFVTEYDSESEGSWDRLIKAGLPVHLHNDSGIMHNKYFVVDEKYVVTGSTNLTEGMWSHFNNMIIIHSPELATDYLRDFHVQKTGTSATGKDDRFKVLYGSGAGADETIGTGDDTTPGDLFGNKVICNPAYPGLDSGICNEILAGSKKWKDITLTDAQWAAIQNTGFARELYSVSDYNQFKGKWPEGYRRVGVHSIGVFFTPYRETFPSYLYESGSTGGRDYYYMNYDSGLLEVKNNENAMNIVLPLLEAATQSITVYSFAFTDKVIIDRLIKAKEQRGVDVKVYMDYNMFRSTYQYNIFSYRELAERTQKVKVTRRTNGGLLHHKVILIDRDIVILGSLNFSENAVSSNDENFVVIRNARNLVDAFETESFQINRESKFLLDLEAFSGAYDANDAEISPFDLTD